MNRGKMGWRRYAVFFACCLLTSCSAGVDGAPAAEAASEPWDPCSIPPDAIAATGLDPLISENGWGEGIVVPEWERCVWRGPASDSWYFFGILYSAQHTLTEIEAKPENQDFASATFKDHSGVLFRVDGRDLDSNCNAAFDTSTGVAWLTVNALGTTGSRGDPCSVLEIHAADLARYFPPPA